MDTGLDFSQAELSKACRAGNKDTVELLLSVLGSPDEQKQAILTLDYISKRNALHLACRAGNKDTVGLLLSKFASPYEQKQAILTHDRYSMNALHCACASGNKDTVELLLSAFGSPDGQKQAILTPDGISRNALRYACKAGNTNIVMTILDHVVCGNTIGDRSSVVGLLKVVQLLLSVFDDDPEQLEHLITQKDQSGRNCLFGSDDSSTALVFKSLQELLEPHELEKHILAVDKKGNSPIHNACRHGNQETVKCLLDGLPFTDQYHALKAKNKNGKSALDLLKRRNEMQMVHKYTNKFYVDPVRPGQGLLYYTTFDRPKWKEELDLAQSVLKMFNIKITDVIGDVPEDELMKRVRDFRCHADPGSSVWLFIMSHGYRGSVIQCGVKTDLALQELVNELAADPNLADTPKVIVTNCCRGIEEGIKEDVAVNPKGSNLLLFHSTQHGAASKRGVLFDKFDECLKENKGKKLEFMDLVRDITRRVGRATEGKQLPQIAGHLTKRLYFQNKYYYPYSE